MIKSIFYAATIAVFSFGSTIANSAVIVGFEGSNVLLGTWQNTSPSSQSPNQTAVSPVITQSDQHVTEGANSGIFKTTWKVPSVDTNNPFSGGGFTAPVWGVRYNLQSPTALVNNSFSTADGKLEMDLYNPNNYVVHVALYCDTESSTQLERGPYLAIQPLSTGAYAWDMAVTAPVGWITGNGVWDSPNARIKGMIVVADSVDAPEAGEEAFSLFVDNIRDTNSQIDTVAPANPTILSAKQSSVPNEVLLNWLPNTESDLAKYEIYVAEETAFGSPTANRIVFSTTPVKTVNAPATSTNVPVTAETIQYIMIRAVDNATPIANQSGRSMVLAVRLKGDGSAVENHIVLDYSRTAINDGAYVLEGYAQGAAYSATALAQNSKYFDSTNALAVDSGSFVLTPNSSGLVVWSNILDGSGGLSVALSEESVQKLTDYVAANGNLLISGAGLCEDLNTRGLPQQTFLANVLKAELVNANAATGIINGSGTLFPLFTGEYKTTFDIYTLPVATSTLSNEVLNPINGAIGDSSYNGGASSAIVASENKVVVLGFAFETVGKDGDIANSRKDLMSNIIDYVTGGSDVSDWNLY